MRIKTITLTEEFSFSAYSPVGQITYFLSRPFDRFIVTKTKTATVRRCPFCNDYIKDEPGAEINLIVHLGEPTPKHTSKREWADYVTVANRW
jgi:hypothetical protein